MAAPALAKIEFCKPENTAIHPRTAVPQNPKAAAEARFSVAGKKAIVTGGARGLGLESATALLEHGLSGLCIFDANAQNAEAAVQQLSNTFSTARIVSRLVNVADEEQVGAVMQEVAEMLDGIDILINFAGIVGVIDALDIEAADWRKMLDINLTGGFLCAQAVAKTMIARSRPGSIIFIASISGHAINFPQPQASYNVSKAGVLHMTRTLAAEWARYGIRVNSISPGYMDTVLNVGDHLTEAKKIWYEKTPMARMGRKEELTGPVVLLASDASSFMTGSDIKVDGGITLT